MNSQNWYDMWMKQNQAFMTSAQSSLKDLFNQPGQVDPQANMKQIQEWMETLQSQWNTMNLTKEQEKFQQYWEQMAKMSSEAAELMLNEWVKRAKDDKPVQTIHELYELWLECCHEVYSKAMKTPDFQQVYGDFMNAAMQFWQGKK